MNEKSSNKKERKKFLILVLLLICLIGITGYGAYSYFWTKGLFEGTDTISVAAFDPETDVNGFIGNGGTVTLTCPNVEDGYGTVDCTGSVEVTNNGGTPIEVSISNAQVDVDHYGEGDSATATAGDPTFGWTTTTIESNNSKTLSISVPVTVSSEFASDQGYERTSEEYDGESFEVTVTFDIKAKQVNN